MALTQQEIEKVKSIFKVTPKKVKILNFAAKPEEKITIIDL